jgi:hypothetical protein
MPTPQMAEQSEQFVVIPVKEFERHMAQVNVCVGMLNGVMSALAQNPMFAGFLPADLRERIAELSD